MGDERDARSLAFLRGFVGRLADAFGCATEDTAGILDRASDTLEAASERLRRIEELHSRVLLLEAVDSATRAYLAAPGDTNLATLRTALDKANDIPF